MLLSLIIFLSLSSFHVSASDQEKAPLTCTIKSPNKKTLTKDTAYAETLIEFAKTAGVALSEEQAEKLRGMAATKITQQSNWRLMKAFVDNAIAQGQQDDGYSSDASDAPLPSSEQTGPTTIRRSSIGKLPIHDESSVLPVLLPRAVVVAPESEKPDTPPVLDRDETLPLAEPATSDVVATAAKQQEENNANAEVLIAKITGIDDTQAEQAEIQPEQAQKTAGLTQEPALRISTIFAGTTGVACGCVYALYLLMRTKKKNLERLKQSGAHLKTIDEAAAQYTIAKYKFWIAVACSLASAGAYAQTKSSESEKQTLGLIGVDFTVAAALCGATVGGNALLTKKT